MGRTANGRVHVWDRVPDGIRSSPPGCPEHGATMLEKSSEYGCFWGCPRYPNCREKVPVVLRQAQGGKARFWSGRMR